MAGPKIPSGSLKGHASQAKKAARQGPFDITKSVVPKLDPKTFTGDDSESSSGSESGSSLSDMGTNNLSTADLRKRLYQQTPSKDKTNGTKDKDHAKFSKTATPAKSTTINGLKDSVKKQPSMVAIKQEDTSSSSESESESSSDEKAKKASAYGKVVEKSEPQSKSTSELESSSSSEDDSESESESEDEDEDNSEDTVQQIEQQMKNDVKTARSQSSQARAQSSSEEPSKKKAKRREPVSEDEDGDIDMMEESMALTNGGKSTNVFVSVLSSHAVQIADLTTAVMFPSSWHLISTCASLMEMSMLQMSLVSSPRLSWRASRSGTSPHRPLCPSPSSRT